MMPPTMPKIIQVFDGASTAASFFGSTVGSVAGADGVPVFEAPGVSAAYELEF